MNVKVPVFQTEILLTTCAIERHELSLLTILECAIVCVNPRLRLAEAVDVFAHSPILLTFHTWNWFHAHRTQGNLIISLVGTRAVMLGVGIMLRTENDSMTLIIVCEIDFEFLYGIMKFI